MKRCSRCGQTDPDQFNKNRAEPDGLQRWCKGCRKQHSVSRRREIHDRILEEEAEYRRLHADHLREYHRAYAHAHRDSINEAGRRSKMRWKSRTDAYNAQYRDGHRAEHRAANRSWFDRNRDRYSDYAHQRRARLRGANVESVSRAEIFERDNWTCYLCNHPIDPTCRWPDPWSPSIDHVQPLAKLGPHARSNLRAAHLRCNMQKFTKIKEA